MVVWFPRHYSSAKWPKASWSRTYIYIQPDAVFDADYESDVSFGFNSDIFDRTSKYFQDLVKKTRFFSFESFSYEWLIPVESQSYESIEKISLYLTVYDTKCANSNFWSTYGLTFLKMHLFECVDAHTESCKITSKYIF